MATMTGKRARRTGGNRYACKRSHRRSKPDKVARWKAMERERAKRQKSVSAW